MVRVTSFDLIENKNGRTWFILNQKKVDSLYTGYVIFTKKNCGNDFLSKIGDGTVGLDVYDIKAMYSADGIYYRDAGDSTSSAVFQFTKTKNGWFLTPINTIIFH